MNFLFPITLPPPDKNPFQRYFTHFSSKSGLSSQKPLFKLICIHLMIIEKSAHLHCIQLFQSIICSCSLCHNKIPDSFLIHFYIGVHELLSSGHVCVVSRRMSNFVNFLFRRSKFARILLFTHGYKLPMQRFVSNSP